MLKLAAPGTRDKVSRGRLLQLVQGESILNSCAGLTSAWINDQISLFANHHEAYQLVAGGFAGAGYALRRDHSVFPETSVIGTSATLDFGVKNTPIVKQSRSPPQACKCTFMLGGLFKSNSVSLCGRLDRFVGPMGVRILFFAMPKTCDTRLVKERQAQRRRL
jgi:hypothetical protein